MKNKSISLRITLTLAALLMIFTGVAAQEGGFIETFDSAEMAGWEHSPEAAVKDGVLSISAGHYAIRIGDYDNFTAAFKVKYAGEGLVFFRFNMIEGGDYSCIFHQDSIAVERVTEGTPQELARLDNWSGFSGDWDTVSITKKSGSITISFNDQQVIQGQDSGEPLRNGGLGFMVEGAGSAEFDDFSVTLLESESMPAGQEPQAEQAVAPAPTAVPTAQSGIDGLLAQLSASGGNPPELSTFAINLVLSVLLSYILSRVYVHWGSSLSNRRRFAANFILITVTTTFIILVVRSSVALSLGLVGALSIVRFRAAIKEPEELAYLFFAISIGIGLGDNQRLITVFAMAVVFLVIAVMRLFRGRQADFNLHLTVASAKPQQVALESISKVLRANTAQSRLMRFDESPKMVEASYLVEFTNSAQFEKAKNALKSLSDDLRITFLDNKGLG
jgi:hypothetical protein